MGVVIIPNLAYNMKAQNKYNTMNYAAGLEAQISLGAMVSE